MRSLASEARAGRIGNAGKLPRRFCTLTGEPRQREGESVRAKGKSANKQRLHGEPSPRDCSCSLHPWSHVSSVSGSTAEQ